VSSISFNNSVCVPIIVYKVKFDKTVRTFHLLDILYTHAFRCNWYTSLLTAGRNSSCLGLKTRDATDSIPFYQWDATDTLEAVTFGCNWYNFLTAGRNSYFPVQLNCTWNWFDIWYDIVVPSYSKDGLTSIKFSREKTLNLMVVISPPPNKEIGKSNYSVINEQYTYKFELGNQSRTDATSFRVLTRAVHCTYKYVQLRYLFPFCRKVAEFMNFQWTSSMANSVMHWKIRTFLDVSAALLYIVHCNQANALNLVEILVILTCLVNVKYCSDFYAEEEFISWARDADFCWVSKVSCVGCVRKPFLVHLRELSNSGEQLFRKII